MPKKSLKDQIKDQIESLTATLTESRASLVLWESTVRQEEAELRKLQGAWASLSGMNVEPFSNVEMSSIPVLTEAQAAKGATAYKMTVPGSHLETVDNIEYSVEDGFEISKNSFGEIAIVPKGSAPLPAMAEPLKPGPVASSLPPLSGSEGFDRPEDLL